jgi:hypothetical protein
MWLRVAVTRPCNTQQGKRRWIKDERTIGIYSVNDIFLWRFAQRLEKWDTIEVEGFPEPRLDRAAKSGIVSIINAGHINLICRQYTPKEIEQSDFIAMYQTEEQKKFYENFVELQRKKHDQKIWDSI